MNPILIAIAGGSASGKTTVVKKIIEQLNSKDITVISHDDYYKDLTHLALTERYKVNFDHPDSIDNDLFVAQLKDLLDGKSISKPKYDFVEHNRSSEYELVEPTKIIIIEGILILEDERVRDLATIKLFVESDDDIRFIRRLVRDTKERGRSIESVINQYLTTVKPMYYAFIKPTKRYADIIIPNDSTHDVAVDCIARMINDMLNVGKLELQSI
jgi:uridine kinase